MVRMTKWLAAAAVLVVGAGCDQSPVSAPGTWDAAPAALVVPSGSRFMVIACKQGPEGPSWFRVKANTADVTLASGATFALGNDTPCRTVATTTSRMQSVTVEEVTPARGSVFVGADIYRYHAGTLTQTLVNTSTSPVVTVSRFGADIGWVIVFRNKDG